MSSLMLPQKTTDPWGVIWLNSYIVKPLNRKKPGEHLNPNTLEAEAGLYGEFHNSQSHIMKPCLKN